MNPRALVLGLMFLASSAGTARAADAPLPDLPDYVFAVAPEEEDLDVLYFGDAGPTVIRFRVRIGDRGFRTAWDSALARLYSFADSDGDGTLTEFEAARPGWRQLIGNPTGGLFAIPDPSQAEAAGPLRPKDGKVSLDEFRRHVIEGLGHAPLQSSVSRSAEPLHQSAFNQLDADRDGALTPAELAGAEDLIRRLDADEDEVVDQAELDPNRNPFAGIFFVSNSSVGGDAQSGPFLPLTTPEDRSRAARRLLSRSDGSDASTRDEKLTPAEAGLPPEAFRLADLDADGRLDLAEIERFLARPIPSISLVVRLPGATGQAATLRLPTPAEGGPPPDSRVSTKPDGTLTLALDRREVRLTPNDTVQDFSQFFNQRFESADLDKDGALDRSESGKDRFFPRIFDAADRDGDGRLKKAELTLYLERTMDLSRSRATIAINDTGRPFFEKVDADGDGRLGRRELRNLARSLKVVDRDGDGKVRLEEIAETSQVAIGRGPFSANRRGFSIETYDTPIPPRPVATGPEVAWFRRMDRNRDGDVSPGEFLGPPQDFRNLDADHDGLIDSKEAAKGP